MTSTLIHLTGTAKQHITNALGSKTRRKIVVIESDDWGAIRMPSQRVYAELEKKGLPKFIGTQTLSYSQTLT